MSSASLAQVQATLATLRSYKLDERSGYEPSPSPCDLNDDDDSKTSKSGARPKQHQQQYHLEPILDKNTVQRYYQARESYLRSRMDEMLLQHLGTIECKPRDGDEKKDNTEGPGRYKFQFTYPPIPTEEEETQLQLEGQVIRKKLLETVAKVNDSYGNLYSKYDLFCRKREELERIFKDVEQSQSKSLGESEEDVMEDIDNSDGEQYNDDIDDDYDDSSIDENQLAIQDEKIRCLMARRKELECTLRRKRMEVDEVTVEVDRSKRTIKKMLEDRGAVTEAAAIHVDDSNNGDTTIDIDARNSKGGDGYCDDNGKEETDDLQLKPLEEMEAENEELRRRVREVEAQENYFKELLSAVEQIGMIRILSITTPSLSSSSQQPQQQQQVISKSPRRKSPRFNNGTPTNNKRGSPIHHSPQDINIIDNTNNSDLICLKLQLFDEYIVAITLKSIRSSSSPSSPTSQGGVNTNNGEQQPSDEVFRVVGAQLLTSPVFKDEPSSHPSFGGRSSNPKGTVITTPSLDDLVKLSGNLEPIHDIRFVVRETMSRIRALTARVDELVRLRSKYLTKITGKSSSSSSSSQTVGNNRHHGRGSGVEDHQEVVCSLNAGITAVLHLTVDCPMSDGSAYIHQIVGVGGWDDGCLKRMKARVNGKKSRGPLDVMDALVEEIARVEKEEGVDIPRTPVFPKRNGGGDGRVNMEV